MTNKEAIKWLQAIKDKHIHGGDEAFDESRREALDMACEALEERPTGKWIDCTNYGFVECPLCHSATNTNGAYHSTEVKHLRYCWWCGARMEVDNVKSCSSCAHFNNGNRKPYPCGNCFANSHNMWEAENEND